MPYFLTRYCKEMGDVIKYKQGKALWKRSVMEIFCLCENTAKSSEFLCEHGLSLYIKTKNKTILFDFGQSDVFFQNAQKLGIDLSTVDYAILSHGHYDHGNGLKKLFEENKSCKVFAHKSVFEDFYHGDRFIGLDKTLDKSRFLFIDDNTELEENIRLFTSIGQKEIYPLDSCGLSVKKNALEADRFDHEIYLEIEENGKKYLFSGCAHKGILNIISRFTPDIFIGGFHLSGETPSEDNEKLRLIRTQLASFSTRLFTCHCTGEAQYKLLKHKLDLQYLSSGDKTVI